MGPALRTDKGLEDKEEPLDRQEDQEHQGQEECQVAQSPLPTDNQGRQGLGRHQEQPSDWLGT